MDAALALESMGRELPGLMMTTTGPWSTAGLNYPVRNPYRSNARDSRDTNKQARQTVEKRHDGRDERNGGFDEMRRQDEIQSSGEFQIPS